MIRPVPSFPTRHFALGLVASVGVACAAMLPVALAQDRANPRAAALNAEPVIDMEVTVIMREGPPVEGTLVSITPQRLRVRTGDEGGAGGEEREIDRARVQRIEYDVVLVMRDGQRMTGRLVGQTAEWITVRIAGVEARVPVESVERLELQLPVRKRYEQMRALIDDGDVERLLIVAEWLRGVGLYEEALRELDHILQVDRFNDRARQLRELVSRQIEMRERRDRRAQERAAEPPKPRDPESKTAPAGDEEVETEEQADAAEASGRHVPLGHRRDFPVLSDAQVNLMKVYELDLRDPPRLLIERATIDRLLQQFAGSPLLPATRAERDRFYRKSPEEILDLMFQLQARDLYGEVRVLGGVKSMEKFRDTVQTTWLLQNCSTSGCHGDANPSGLTLYRRRPGSEQSVYTNFLILDRYRTSDGMALIDWQTPDRSLLMQMGMNRDNAFRPHPDVRGWRPVFRTVTDRRFRDAVEWIGSMYRPRTEVPIEYHPPGEAARAAQPDAAD